MKLELAGGAGRTILEYDTPVLLSTIFARQGIPVEMPCGGRQRCLKCRVKASGELSPLTQRERELLTPDFLRSLYEVEAEILSGRDGAMRVFFYSK